MANIDQLRMRRQRFNRLNRGAAVACCFLAAAGFGLAAVGQYDDNRALIDHGMPARATVVDASGPVDRTQWLSLRFSLPTGQVVIAPRVQDIGFAQRPDVGEQVDIVYDPEQPQRVVAAAATGPDPVVPYLLGTLAALFTVGGLISWRRLRAMRTAASE